MADIEVKYLQVIVMPNGEVISNGKTIGMADELDKYLVTIDPSIFTK